jgi:hypothetical protein
MILLLLSRLVKTVESLFFKDSVSCIFVACLSFNHIFFISPSCVYFYLSSLIIQSSFFLFFQVVYTE